MILNTILKEFQALLLFKSFVRVYFIQGITAKKLKVKLKYIQYSKHQFKSNNLLHLIRAKGHDKI
jgi:hypothetical protein